MKQHVVVAIVVNIVDVLVVAVVVVVIVAVTVVIFAVVVKFQAHRRHLKWVPSQPTSKKDFRLSKNKSLRLQFFVSNTSEAFRRSNL